MKVITICILVFAVIGLNSCVGVSADISIRADGSGRIALEYRLSRVLESTGRLDGNERWPIIPVGRADFERGLARIPDLRLRSFSSKEVRGVNGGTDLVVRAVLEFKSTAALLAFLDITGGHASLSRDNGKNLLRLTLLDPSPYAGNDADLISLLREISAGYEMHIGLTAPGNAGLAVVPPSVSAARLVSQGRNVSFTIGMGELLDLTGGLALEIAW